MLQVVPVPTRIDRTEHELGKSWDARSATALAPVVVDWIQVARFGTEADAVSGMLNFLSVPYVPFWSYGERLPAIQINPAIACPCCMPTRTLPPC